jgi:hypothetical protein
MGIVQMEVQLSRSEASALRAALDDHLKMIQHVKAVGPKAFSEQFV